MGLFCFSLLLQWFGTLASILLNISKRLTSLIGWQVYQAFSHLSHLFLEVLQITTHHILIILDLIWPLIWSNYIYLKRNYLQVFLLNIFFGLCTFSIYWIFFKLLLFICMMIYSNILHYSNSFERQRMILRKISWLKKNIFPHDVLQLVYVKCWYEDTLAEWLRRWPAKSMGSPRESSNLSGVEFFFPSSTSKKTLKDWEK